VKIQYILGVTSLLLTTQILAKDFDYKLSVAAVGMSMDYSEYSDNGELLDTEVSDLNGIMGLELKASYTRVDDIENSTEIGINFMILGGETQYTGSLIGSSEGYGSYLGVTTDTIRDIELEYRHNYKLNNDFEFMYGVGFGHREWRRELSSTQVEIYSWYSLRPKIGINYKYNDFSLGALFEYQYGINPEMSLDIPGTYVVLDLGSADISKFSLPLKYKYSEEFNLFTEFVYEKKIIEKSNIAEGWQEPRSEAYNQYLKFGAEFKF